MSDVVNMTFEDRMKYHEALLSDKATTDDMVYAWDFFMEMATWTSKIIEDKVIREKVKVKNAPAKPI